MRTSTSWAALAIAAVVMGCPGPDSTTDPVSAWDAALIGANEVPAVNSPGVASGTFSLNATGDTLVYALQIATGVGTAVTQSHIHTGNAGATGGIAVWFCGTASNPGPAGTPTCAIAGTSAGTLITGRVALPAATLTSMRNYGTYANIHTTGNTGGEIRGQLRNIAP